jgi:uncharacterized tellurite resistance protein B-like protein
MIRRDILELLAKRPSPAAGPASPFDREQIAAAALMVECAEADTEFAPEERDVIYAAVREQFGFDAETSRSLIEVAEQRAAEVLHDWLFLEAVKQGFTEGEQRELLERLWEVAYADGRMHTFEVRLISHIARELGLGEAVVEEARTRARERMGGDPGERHH